MAEELKIGTAEEREELAEQARAEAGDEAAMLFETHQMMAEDLDYEEAIEDRITNQKMNAEAAVSELVSLGVRAGIPEDRARIELVYAATRCGYTEEEERDALYCSLDNDVDERSGKEEKDE